MSINIEESGVFRDMIVINISFIFVDFKMWSWIFENIYVVVLKVKVLLNF